MTAFAPAREVRAVQTINIVRKLCQLRGGSKAIRVMAEDGGHYVLKLQGNPQGNNSLVAEYVGTQVLDSLGLPVAQHRLAYISNPELRAELGLAASSSDKSLHLALAYPTNPEKNTIFDILPESNLRLVENRRVFWGALVADRWLANQDCRQAIFLRRRSMDKSKVLNMDPTVEATGISAILIDQGMCFNGRALDFKTAPAHGLYSDAAVYAGLTDLAQLEPWITLAQGLQASYFHQVLTQIPTEWLNSNSIEKFTSICEHLPVRAQRLMSLLASTLNELKGRASSI